MMPRLFAALLSVGFATSLRAAPPAYVYQRELAAKCEKIAHMHIGPNGVTRAQANRLADAYFAIYLGGCGGPEPAQPMKGYWSVPVVVGYGAVHEGAFRIDHVTGAVSYRG